MTPEKPIFTPTADGSTTLYLPHLDEHYHSIKGALTESLHVYIETALHAIEQDEIALFECGFGTGLNAFLTLLDCEKSHRKVHYQVIEAFPLDVDTASALQYPRLIAPDTPHVTTLFTRLHSCEWNSPIEITPYFTLHKILGDITTYPISENSYDVIYYDAFAPEKQPELWSEELLSRIARSLRHSGVLSTYCAKGEIRRRLTRAGLTVHRTPGPIGGKREILQAFRNI